jgi:hypothetical protein
VLLVLVSDSTQLLCNEAQEQVRILASILERAASGSDWETEKLASLRMLFQCELEEADGYVSRLHGAGRMRKNACSKLASGSCGSRGCTSSARNPSAIFTPATRRAFIGQVCFAQTRFCELRPNGHLGSLSPAGTSALPNLANRPSYQAALKNRMADAPTTTTSTSIRMAGTSTTRSALPVLVECISRGSPRWPGRGGTARRATR